MTMTLTPKIVALSVGKPKTMAYQNQEMVSGICKEQITEVFLSRENFNGDAVANTDFHGGPERAVCAYPIEHYAMWEKEFDIRLPQAAFGENLTVANMMESQVCIGDLYQIGDAVVQVSQGRIPCSTISKRHGVDTFLTRIVEEGFTGYFFRVLKEGVIRNDSVITLLERHPKEITVLFANRILFHEQDNVKAVKKVLEVEELAPVWRGKLNKLLAK